MGTTTLQITRHITSWGHDMAECLPVHIWSLVQFYIWQYYTLLDSRWRNNVCDGVSNHPRLGGLLNRLFGAATPALLCMAREARSWRIGKREIKPVVSQVREQQMCIYLHSQNMRFGAVFFSKLFALELVCIYMAIWHFALRIVYFD